MRYMQVVKRDNSLVEFDINKIIMAMSKAFTSVRGGAPIGKIKAIASYIQAECEDLEEAVSVEKIQDMVENELMTHGFPDVAKAYILYRHQHENVRETKETLLDATKIVEKYVKVEDWRVKENSTVTYSVGGLILSEAGAITANYWLNNIYDKEIADAHRNCDFHIHDLSMLTGYCAGWSLKQLIQEGLGGVPGKISSSPAKHLSSLCNQMVNFLGILQNEWAGAQAFSSFDTYLAPFVKADNLTYEQTKKCIESFVYGVNIPSRWGCVDKKTEVLSVDGFKHFDELKKGDLIYTWKDGRLELNPVNKVVVKPFKGKLHSYRANGYNQTITPTHRMLVRKEGEECFQIRHSEEVFGEKEKIVFPVAFRHIDLKPQIQLEEEIVLAVAAYLRGKVEHYGDGRKKIIITVPRNNRTQDILKRALDVLNIEYLLMEDGDYSFIIDYESSKQFWYFSNNDEKKVPSWFTKLDQRQSNYLLNIWGLFDDISNPAKLDPITMDVSDILQHVAIRAGQSTYLEYDEDYQEYVHVGIWQSIEPTERVEVEYDDDVWCPNVDNGTAVFRKDGCVYISGQTQSPFSNITLDWTCPDDLKNLPAIVGGKEMPFTYGDCKKEMDMVNRAFLETMIAGDCNGRGFQYPIPTYSITKDFDWSDTENNRLLFEMTAKYGTPYFSNYVNSDMNPSDVRSMAILGTQELIYMDRFGRISKNEVRHLVHQWMDNPKTEYSVLMNGEFVKIIDMFEVPYQNYKEYVSIKMKNGQKQNFSWDHKCIVVRNGKITDVLAQDVLPSDKVLLAKHGYNESNIGSYEAGKIIGYYLAEGWVEHDGKQVSFAINDQHNDICVEIQTFFETNFGCRVAVDHWKENHIYKVKVFSAGAVNYVQQFIDGSKATEKHITTATYDTSLDFRRGIYDGYLVTDGCERAKIFAHTTNKTLCNDMISLFATIGKYFSYQIDANNTRYDLENRTDVTYKLNPEVFNDDYYVVDVDSVDFVNATRINTVYNFTVDTPEHIYELPNGVITHQCCRLRLELRELRKKNGGYFGSGESTGSVGVVTINMPRLAYLSKTKEEFYDRLKRLMDIAARSLDIKRRVITKLLDEGLYPYTKHYLGSFENHFSTLGLIGMNEAGLNAAWLKKDLTHPETVEFTKEVLQFMKDRLSDYQEQYSGTLFNLEATPAESVTYRFAKHDKEQFPDIITAAGDCGTPYYTNSSHLPVGFTEDVFSALDVQDDLQTMYTSGTVFHAFLGEKLPSWESAARLVRKIAENYKLPYYTLSPTYSVCREHGYLAGEQSKCPICGKPTEVYSRITGYYRPVQNWNDGKSQEFRDRKVYVISDKPQRNRTNLNETTPKLGDVPSDKPERNTSAEEADSSKRLVLFTTATCPKCVMAKKFLNDAGIEYEVSVVDKDPGFAMKYEVRQAPTLLILEGEKEIERIENPSNIRAFTER